MIYAGIGCRRDCSPQDVLAAIRLCATQAGQPPAALATPDFKCNEPALRAAAATLGVPLIAVTPADMRAAQPRCPTRSAAAQAATGLPSIAEAAALAAAGPGGHLLLARVVHGGATCALAQGPSA